MISGLEGRRIADTATLLRTRRISATELVREAIARAENRRDLNAFTLLMGDQALADAAEVDREIAAGRYRGPLHGIPITVKDLVDVARHADDGRDRGCRRRSRRPTRRSSAACAKPA